MPEINKELFKGFPSPYAYRRASYAIEKFLGKIQVRGNDFPEEPTVIVATHQSYLDPLVLGKIFFDLRREPLRYMAKQELFEVSPFRWLIDKWGAFPVDRPPGNPISGIRAGIDIVKGGGSVVVFAQGGIKSTIEDTYGGAFTIASTAKAPITFVGIAGISPLERGCLSVGIGDTIGPEEAHGLRRKKDVGLETMRCYMQAAQDKAGGQDDAEGQDLSGRYYAIPIV